MFNMSDCIVSSAEAHGQSLKFALINWHFVLPNLSFVKQTFGSYALRHPSLNPLMVVLWFGIHIANHHIHAACFCKPQVERNSDYPL